MYFALSTYNHKVEVNLLGIIEIDSLIDGLDLVQYVLLVFFFNEGTSTTPLFTQVATERLVEIDQGDDISANVGLLKLTLHLGSNRDHSARGTAADSQDERLAWVLCISIVLGVRSLKRHRRKTLVLEL